MRDGHRVVDAEPARQRELGRPGCRHDAVDHRVRKRAARVDPLGKVRVRRPCERDHGLAQHRAVALEVVAALPGERPDAPVAPAPERRHHRAERGAGAVRVGGVVPDIGMRRVEALGRGLDVVPALRHRQRDDTDRGIGHRTNEGGISLLDRHIVDHRAGHLRRYAGRVELDQRRQAVLPQELRALRRIVGTHPGADDRPVAVEATLEQPVQVPGLVRAVEVAEPDMDDPRSQGRAVIARPRNRLRQVVEGGVRKSDHGHARGRPTVTISSAARRRRHIPLDRVGGHAPRRR